MDYVAIMKKFFKSLDLLKIFVLLAAVLFLWFKGKDSLDPDFGWHYRMGELILKSGIPKTDPFSYTMPSFPYIDHEWLTNVMLFKVNNLFGYSFLALLFAVIAVFGLAVIVNGFKKEEKGRFFELSLLFLAIGALLPFFGVRPQVLSWVFLALWLKVILDENIFKKYWFILPFLMIVWANLHGSFAIGIFCLGMVLGLRTLRTKKIKWREIVCFLLCFGVTFVNPYGWHLWKEVWRTVSDSALRWRIIEWSPSLLTPVLPYLFLVSFGALIYFFRKNVTWEKLGLYFFFLIQSLLGLRYIPLFVVVCLLIYLEVIELLYKQVSTVKFGKERWRKLGLFLVFLSLLTFGLQSFFAIRNSKFLAEGYFYPSSAVAFLKQNPPRGNFFSSYNWGGFLIWQLPEKKVFIDGRMPSWRWQENFPNESANAMDDYIKMQTNEEDFKKGLKKYNITLVLWPKEREQKGLEKLLGNFLLDKLTKLTKKSNFSMIEYLKKNSWQKIYEDNLSQIYSKD